MFFKKLVPSLNNKKRAAVFFLSNFVFFSINFILKGLYILM